MAEQRDNERGHEGDRIIDDRLLDEGRTSQAEIVGAAQAGFVEDQRDPDHPTRKDRAHGVEDPSHSRASTRQGPGAQDLGRE